VVAVVVVGITVAGCDVIPGRSPGGRCRRSWDQWRALRPYLLTEQVRQNFVYRDVSTALRSLLGRSWEFIPGIASSVGSPGRTGNGWARWGEVVDMHGGQARDVQQLPALPGEVT
jgi:hypothetical protein